MDDSRRAVLNASLERGAAYLSWVQRSDGGFDSFSSPSATHFTKEATYRTSFVPSLILAAVSDLPLASSRHMKRRLASFVAKQAGPLGSFNYWAKSSPERQRQPYPDDLDDTCCALIGLVLNDGRAVGPDMLASLVKLLVAAETQPGGPYRTWLAAGSDSTWQDVDLAVNANVAYLLSLVSQPLPRLTAFMETAIREDRLSSPYYPSSYSIIYYLARAYDGSLIATLRTAARHLQRTPAAQTALDCGLLLSSLLRLGETEPAALRLLAKDLMALQQPDGSWAAAAFCLDPTRAGISYYNGSESLTTAFALEALQLYNQYGFTASKTAYRARQKRSFSGRDPAFDGKILNGVQRDCRQLAPDLRRTTLQFLERVMHSDSGAEIVELPLRFTRSLCEPFSGQFLLAQLGTANLYGWAAYTLFDDFLDDAGESGQLPAAIASLRYSLAAFQRALPDDPAFQRLVWETFDVIDGANAWEMSHCRFERSGRYLVVEALPDYDDPVDLADRSLGHSLTPLAILTAKGIGPNTRLFQGVRQVMIHYLAARQLNDDAHDWQADLQKGHISYVVARILAEAGIKPGRHVASVLLKQCQQQFWYHTLPKVCGLIQQQTILSRRSLSGLHELRSHNTFTELLDGIDATVVDTLAAQSDAETFLKHFRLPGRQAAGV